jgi:hypothetical protein
MSATTSISAKAGLSRESPGRRYIRLLHIADNGLTAIVHMDVLDADKLLPAVPQASKYFDLSRVSPHQASRRRPEGYNSPLRSARRMRPLALPKTASVRKRYPTSQSVWFQWFPRRIFIFTDISTARQYRPTWSPPSTTMICPVT